MSTFKYEQHFYTRAENESVLACLLRQKVEYPYGCLSGVCQACLVKSVDGAVEEKWQVGLPDTLKVQGYFLACQAKPSHWLELVSPNAQECDHQARIEAIQFLNRNVIQVKLITANLEKWVAGQYLNVVTPSSLCRSYSIANLPSDEGYIELHVKLTENGMMSRWWTDEARVGQSLSIRGPFGKCFYFNPDHRSFNLLLAGTGTGLAPLLGIIKSAIRHRHQGHITLIHGGVYDDDLYYDEALQTLSLIHQQVSYYPCALKSQGQYPTQSIVDIVLSCLIAGCDQQVYLCGPKETIQPLKTKVFLAGVPSQRIYSDPFF